MAHSNTLGNKLAEDQGEIGQDQGDQYDGNRIDRFRMSDRHVEGPNNISGKALRKVISRKRRAKESGQGNADLNAMKVVGVILLK